MTSACRCFQNSDCKGITKKAATQIVTAFRGFILMEF